MNRITILTAIFLITILSQDQGIIKTHSYARGISHLALQQKEKKKAGSSHADDIAKYERDILKSFSNGNYFKLYDNIEKFVLRFPENPISLLYVYDLTRLSDIYGFERTVKTLKQIITKIEKKTDFKHRNNTLLLLKLELEKLLYRFRIKDAENLSKKLAPLRKWTLAGPYFKYGASDLYYPFMPEIITRLDIPNLNKKKILLKNRTGRLNLKKYLYPAKGVAYAFTTFKQIKPVKIRIHSDSSYILYINGEKTVENAKGKTFRQVRILRVWGTDEITIMLKLINEDKWDFRVLVTDDDDNILNVSCEPEKLIFTDFKYIEEMEHPFTSIMDKTAKDPADSYLQLGSFFYELNSIEAVEFYKKSLAIKRDILKQFLLASAMIEMCDDINSSFYMEGWQMLMNLASSNPNFIPVQYKYFQKLIQRRSILQAFYKGKELIKKAKYHLQLRLDYIDLLKSLGYDKELIEEIHSLRKDFPCSTAPLIKLAEYYRDKNILKSTSIYRKVIEIDPSQRTIKRLLGIYKEQGRYADAARLINDYDHDSNFNDDLIETYINSGNFESAKNIIFKEMINKDDPYYHLKLGLISFMHDIDPMMYWQKALLLAPSWFTLADFMNYLIDKKIENPFTRYRDEDLKDNFFGQAIDNLKDDGPTILSRSMIFLLNKKGGSRLFCEDIIHIKEKKDIRKWGEYEIPFRGNLLPVRIRVHYSNKKFSDSYKIRNVNGRHFINISSLKIRSIIQISYILENPNIKTPYSDFFATPLTQICGFDESLSRFKVKVITPQEMDVKFCLSEKINFKSEIFENKKIYSISLNNPSKVIHEDFMGHRLNYLPYFAFSTMTKMKDLIIWYNGLLKGVFDINADVINNRFKQGKNLDIINKVYDFVAREIDLRGNILFYPGKARDTLMKNSGTVEDKVVLAKSILNILGIRSYLALTKDYDLPDFGTFVSPKIFSDILLYIPLDDVSGLWMDFSSSALECGTVKSSIDGSKSIVIIQDDHEIKEVKSLSNDMTFSNYNITLNTKGDTDFKIGIDFHGTSGRIRDIFRNKLYNEDMINYYFKDIMPSISIDEYRINNFDIYTSPFKIWARGNSIAFALTGSNIMIFQPILKKSSLYRYVRYAERKYPLIIKKPISEKEEYTYTLPSKFNSSVIERSYDEKNIFGFAKIGIKKTKGSNILKVIKEIEINKTKIIQSKYRKFIDFCLRLKEIEFQNVVIKE